MGENRLIEVQIDSESRTATLTIKGPEAVKLEKSADWYPLRLARELDRAILDLRQNHLDIGLWILKTQGDLQKVLELDSLLEDQRLRLVRARSDRLPAPHALAPRRLVALDLRDHRARARASPAR